MNVNFHLSIRRILFQKSKYFKLERVSPCQNVIEESIIDFSNISAKIQGQILYFSGTITVREELSPPLQTEMFMTRCNQNIAGRCENFNNFTVTDFCTIMHDKEIFGMEFIDNFEPEVRCPVKKGVYDVEKVSVPLEAVIGLPLEGFRWIWRVTFFHMEIQDEDEVEKEFQGCVEAQLRVMVSSVRGKMNG